MKNGIFVSVVVCTVVLFPALICTACPLDGAPIIGPAGGAVFYDKGNYAGDWRYLECAPDDAGTLSGTSGHIDFTQAVAMTANYSCSGFSDWRLPSDTEFEVMWKNLHHTFGAYMGLSINEKNYYLTSDGNAYYGIEKTYEGSSYTVLTKQENPSYKAGCSYKVRPIREF